MKKPMKMIMKGTCAVMLVSASLLAAAGLKSPQLGAPVSDVEASTKVGGDCSNYQWLTCAGGDGCIAAPGGAAGCTDGSGTTTPTTCTSKNDITSGCGLTWICWPCGG